MPLYKATVDLFYSLSLYAGGETIETRRYFLLEAEDVRAAGKEAERIGEANADSGRLLAINVMRVSRISIPAEITYELSERKGL